MESEKNEDKGKNTKPDTRPAQQQQEQEQTQAVEIQNIISSLP
jgi:hypothetical protein